VYQPAGAPSIVPAEISIKAFAAETRSILPLMRSVEIGTSEPMAERSCGGRLPDAIVSPLADVAAFLVIVFQHGELLAVFQFHGARVLGKRSSPAAFMAPPGRVIPDDPALQSAILNGEALFARIGCASCHIPSLPLNNWMYTEPNPYNPAGNLRLGDVPTFTMDLTDRGLPRPRLIPVNGVIQVAAFTDFKLHNICSGPGDPNMEAIDQNQPAGSPGFFGGNQYFVTKRLWSAGSSPNHFHHGKFTTIRESILAHAGEAQLSQAHFTNLNSYDQGSVIEFLKSLKVLPIGTRSRIVDEFNRPVKWPPRESISFPPGRYTLRLKARVYGDQLTQSGVNNHGSPPPAAQITLALTAGLPSVGTAWTRFPTSPPQFFRPAKRRRDREMTGFGFVFFCGVVRKCCSRDTATR
jgi:hypothetical protein